VGSQLHGISGWTAPAGACPGAGAQTPRKPNFQTSGYSTPKTPAARLLAREDLFPATRERVLELRAASDPVDLMRLLRQAQEELGRRVDRRGLKGAREAGITPVTEQDLTNVAGIA
jgi:hypothetical protein